MDQSPLSSLPPEIRNAIYGLVLTQSEPVRIRSLFDRLNDPVNMQDRNQLLALTETCRIIRKESTQLFYALNTFLISVLFVPQNPEKMLKHIYKTIGALNTAALRNLEFDTYASWLGWTDNSVYCSHQLRHAVQSIMRNPPSSNLKCKLKVNYIFEYIDGTQCEGPDAFTLELDLYDMEDSWGQAFEDWQKVKESLSQIDANLDLVNFKRYQHERIYNELCRCREAVPK